MTITIYHNPGCSKSREALERVQHFAALHHRPVNILYYLDTPLSVSDLESLQRQLGVCASDLVRTNEEEYTTQGLAQADEGALLQALEATPRLLQRPIVVLDGKAIIARPPELLDGFLPSS